MTYQAEYDRSINEREAFWKEKAEQLDWYEQSETVLSQDDHGIHHWFADWQMNTCYMALDAHIDNDRGDQTALIYDSPVTNQKRQYTYKALRDEVAKTAGSLQQLNVQKGDRVIIYMPMIPEAAIAMLACARIGAIPVSYTHLTLPTIA